MKVIKRTNYLTPGTVVKILLVKDNWVSVGIVVHPANISTDIKGYQSLTKEVNFLPIIRTAVEYIRLGPDDEIEVLYEPQHLTEFKPKETMIYPNNNRDEEHELWMNQQTKQQ